MYNEEMKPLSQLTQSDYTLLQSNLIEGNTLVNDIVLKQYLYKLSDLDIKPISYDLTNISDIRLFKITEMVYKNNEYATYKFASVFSAMQNLNCNLFIIANSDGQKTEFYMGVRSLDRERTPSSLGTTLNNALKGQFPGVKTENLNEDEIKGFIFKNIKSKDTIASVSCVAKNKDIEFKSNETFIQGLEKLAIAMQGKVYTAIVLAKSISDKQLEEVKHSYETIYTQLSPFATMQLSYGTNEALNLSDALSNGTTTGTAYSKSHSMQNGTSHQEGSSTGFSTTHSTSYSTSAGLSMLSNAITSMHFTKSHSTGYSKNTSTSTSNTTSSSTTRGESTSYSKNSTESTTHTEGRTIGTSNQVQLTMQNKTLLNIMEKIEYQLKHIEECESTGMWECATYILSDFQETSEMGASIYKSIIKGEQSGIETSAINCWTRQDEYKVSLFKDYIMHFIHPEFDYPTNFCTIPITAASLVSSNELAIHMGLPRHSICGFPVIEHAEFSEEVIKYDQSKIDRSFSLGYIFSMGEKTKTKVELDIDSLTMHTFITGSTGSGKSNTVYEILNQVKMKYQIPFLVIEPAKGEYKNIFGKFSDVTVYGTNPNITQLLKINPFKFPQGIHILEHLDRLIEIFNVCWPMYAAMPAILKEAMENAYIGLGWDLNTSENKKGDIYPNFMDLLEHIENVIEDSKYSSHSKGDYSGALLTRVRSLTNGLNGQIFSEDDVSDTELFDKNVIVDLSRIGSSETKALIMGLLIMKLNEYRMNTDKMNRSLAHLTVLEEAHHLLKRISTNQSSESANVLGKSVELLSNSIAEMRTYGEGFIIADQSPSLLDISVIRNTNTKIVLRLPERTDRELVGYAANLNDEQIKELAKLKCGVAAIYQNNWIKPVLVQVNAFNTLQLEQNNVYNKKTDFSIKEPVKDITDLNEIRKQLIYLLIQGRISKKLDFDIVAIEKHLKQLKLSSAQQGLIQEFIEDYKEEEQLDIWNRTQFNTLSRIVTNVLDLRNKVEQKIQIASDFEDLTELLEQIIIQKVPTIDQEVILELSHCLMKDMSRQNTDNPEKRQKIYEGWVDFCKSSK